MNEEIVKKSDEVMLSMLDQMASKDDKSDDEMTSLVNNFTKLTGVRQIELEYKKLEREQEHDKLDAKNRRLDTIVKTAIAGGALAFKLYTVSSLMYFDATGKVVGSFLGRQLFGKWIDREEKF